MLSSYSNPQNDKGAHIFAQPIFHVWFNVIQLNNATLKIVVWKIPQYSAFVRRWMRVNHYAASEGCLNFFISLYMVAYKALLKAQSNMQEILHNICSRGSLLHFSISKVVLRQDTVNNMMFCTLTTPRDYDDITAIRWWNVSVGYLKYVSMPYGKSIKGEG